MRKTLVLIIALVLAAPAAAAIDDSWPLLVEAGDADCTLTVSGNGRFVLIAAKGLGAGDTARYQLRNGDMTPIDWTVRADASGRFARYYVPFRWGRRGGTVQVDVTSESCRLSASFPWERYTG
ncbi:hypothetical protein [Novosphingobium ginsenosidimutans]|uniref:DUF2541 family protein n=1 Tax=Novosphingobium ginsenosidimutans TaxID=1176536 RepID=A0A5B8S5A8_9SPHN|nr:hypothetical protein [Novosphingobium ginsenosidimutans]QEA15927.1 hypothetical protein FRF71_07125 [Novosphingobium ginsenosidimutans]